MQGKQPILKGKLGVGKRSAVPKGHTPFTRLALVHQFFSQPIVAASTASLAYNYMLLFNLPEMVYAGLLGGESPEKIDKVHRLFFLPNLCLVCDSLCQKCIFRTLCGYSEILFVNLTLWNHTNAFSAFCLLYPEL
jgi:hypothetical protein